MSVEDLTVRFFLAAAVILIACRVVSAIVARVGQPPVVGEMIAGVLLGPSLLGLVAPGLEHGLFPKALLPVIFVAGQLGLVTLMFQAGRELRGYLRPDFGRVAVTISGLGVAVPLAAGIALAFAFNGRVAIGVAGVSPWVTSVFIGVALSITAFPMMARIIIERNLSGTRYGSLSLACGAIDDMAAWVMLAGVLSLASGKAWPIVKALAGAAVFAAVLFLVVRPLLARYLRNAKVTPESALLVTTVVAFAAAAVTTGIGLYAVFGAFSAGLAMPPQHVIEGGTVAGTPGPRRDMITPTMDGISKILVAMFFTYSGLNTRFALLSSPRVLLFSLAAIIVAIAAKGGACWLGARLAGERGPVPLRIGAMMNARGLMQLIALNVGLQAGITSPNLFTSLVLVAMVTTIMTPPVLSWIDRREARAARGGLITAIDDPAGEAA